MSSIGNGQNNISEMQKKCSSFYHRNEQKELEAMQDIDVLVMAATSFSATALLFYRIRLSFFQLLNLLLALMTSFGLHFTSKNWVRPIPVTDPMIFLVGQIKRSRLQVLLAISYQDD